MTTNLAFLYTFLVAATIVFQIALILGAPWGHLTQGGANQGSLPPRARVAAVLSSVVLVLMACGVLSGAGLWPNWPRWASWLALAMTAVSLVLNLITPSAAERRLWGPVTAVMFLSALAVMFL